jgi:hypothetical protein
VYGAVPPVAVKLAAPVELPKQRTFVTVMLAVSAAAGCVIVTLAVVVQLLASVMVTLYVPAARFDKSSVVDPFDQLYVYGDVPPVTFKLAAPVELPKHNTLVGVVLALKPDAGCVITTEAVVVQLLASVMVTLYVPAARFDKSSVVDPFDQLYVYGDVPPVTFKLAAPVELPKHNTLVGVVLALKPDAGCVITTEAVVVHPFASVTVTE